MGWIGKLIGGAIGLGLGGPLGLIAGVAFGNLFDRASQYTTSTKTEAYQQQFSPEQQSQMVFFIGAFSMLARIATVDGRLVPEEQAKINEFIDKDLKLDAQSKAAAMRVFNAALSGSGTFRRFDTQFPLNFRHEPAILELMIDIFYRVAISDGDFSSSEEALIREAAAIFGISAALFESIKQRYVGSAKNSVQAYAVLGLQTNASVDDIKRAYRKLSVEFHPDTIASKGLPEEFTVFATEKFREIQQAYDTLKKERTIK